jgi:hypothetical protein
MSVDQKLEGFISALTEYREIQQALMEEFREYLIGDGGYYGEGVHADERIFNTFLANMTDLSFSPRGTEEYPFKITFSLKGLGFFVIVEGQEFCERVLRNWRAEAKDDQ